MNILSYHENLERGTPDFPVEIYRVTENSPKYQMQTHWHKDFEIIHICEGEFDLILNERHVMLTKDQSVIIPGGIIHGARPIKCQYECMVFSPAIFYSSQRCRSLVKKNIHMPVVFDNNSDINHIFDCFWQQEQGFELSVVASLYKIASEIVRSRTDSFALPNAKIEKIKAAISMIEESYNQKLYLSDLSKICQMSTGYFSRYFKQVTGQSPFEYILTYRIEAACGMLSSGTKSITEVCFDSGFNDLSYFIHVFKKFKGVTPRDYMHLVNTQ